jgi:2-amino-4-hydroxy-6-hydroxymethyldihydropteridine diphosphokinase
VAKVYVSIGSNIDKSRHITASLNALADNFGVLDISSVFESESVGFEGDSFLNLVAGFNTDLGVGSLSSILKQMETDNGRLKNAAKFSSRTLDIDILTYDNVIGERDGVLLPRAEILENAFVLWPLAEVAALVEHPCVRKIYSVLWNEYKLNAAFNRPQKLWPIDFIWRNEKISSASV